MKFFKKIGTCIANFFHNIVYYTAYVFCKIFMRCKVIGKENINKEDEARVFVANHMQLYGPVTMHLRCPVKKALWVHKSLMEKDEVEKQLGYGFVEEQFKWIPKFIKRGIVKILKHLVVYVLTRKVNGIAIDRHDTRALATTFQQSLEKIEKGDTIVIFPEVDYPDEGLGEIFPGFTSLAKYVHKKTGKITSFYPVYINQKQKRMYIGEAIKFNPDNPNYSEEVVEYLITEINKMSQIKKPNKKQKKA